MPRYERWETDFTLKSPKKCQKFLNTDISKVIKRSPDKGFHRLINVSVKTFCPSLIVPNIVTFHRRIFHPKV